MKTVTRLLIFTNLAGFALEAAVGEQAVAAFALWPPGRHFDPHLHTVVGFRPWQLVTYAFLHASVAHLLLNMLALSIFGRDVERVLGGRRFLVLYFTAVLSAAGVQLMVVSLASAGPPYPTVGASGGVFGVLLAFAIFYPRRIVMLLFPPIPMPAWLFVTVYGLVELASGVLGTAAGVAHFAHLGGMLGAYVVLRHWRRRGLSDSSPALESI
jgi:membrane associated rhomboid family serine protease